MTAENRCNQTLSVPYAVGKAHCHVSHLFRFARRSALLLLALWLGALVSSGNAQAQMNEVQYGFVRDDADPTRLIAVAMPNADFEDSAFTLNRGSLLTFYLPAGTVIETSPDDLQTDLAFTPLNGTQWAAEVYTDSWMSTPALGLDTGGRDVYRFSLTNSVSNLNATNPLQLFSFSLPSGCDGGDVEVLANADSFSSSLLSGYAISIDNFFPAAVSPTKEAVDLYSGNDALAGSIPCEDPVLAITLAHFYAQADSGQTFFSWQTMTESGSAGFNLLAADGAEWVQLNAEIIPATGIDSLVPIDYQFVADTSSTRFYLEEIHIDNRSVHHGPFTLNQVYGSPAEIGDDVDEPAVYLPLMHR